MSRPHFHRSRCRVCDKLGADVGGISQTGLCPEHSREFLLSNIDQMRARSGPNFAKWRRGMILCAGGSVLDEQRQSA